MARPRKILRESTGDLTVARQEQKKAEEDHISTITAERLNDPPKELRNREAVKTWQRILPDLLKLDVLGNLDRDSLIGYCNAWSMYVECVKAMKKNKDPDETDKLYNRLIKASTEHRRYGKLCGMDLDSRLKMASIKIKQEDEKIEEIFGDI